MTDEAVTADERRDSAHERQMRLALGIVLRGGVLLAAAVVGLGGIAYLARHASAAVAYRQFKGEPESLRSISGIVRGAFAFNGRSVIELGVLLLIATPISRVVFSLVEFALEKNGRYVVITGIVLGLLCYSLMRP
ncbi:MAG: DUF1634 domain-containing protein [Vicinamibacterales bacterium]